MKRTRAAVWTPLPPQTSGIADYSYRLLTELSKLADVVAVNDSPSARVPGGVGLHGPDEPAGGVPVYHMGNHAGVHGWIYREAIEKPGIVVLHDPSLLDFHAGYLGGVASAA